MLYRSKRFPFATIAGFGLLASAAFPSSPLEAMAFQADDSQVSLEAVPVRTVNATATVSGIQSVDIYAKVGGFLKTIDVDLGDTFVQGDVLATLDAPEMATDVLQKEALVKQAEAEAKQAEAAVKEAQARRKGFDAAIVEAGSERMAKQAQLDFESKHCNRLLRLAQSSSIRRELVDEAQLKVQSARSNFEAVGSRVATAQANLAGADAAIEKAEADWVAAKSRIAVAEANLKYTQQLLDYATIKAPWDGVVLSRDVDAGAFIQSAAGNSAAQPLLRIARVDKVRVTFALSNSDVPALKIGSRAVLSRIEGLPGETFEGTVARFAAGLDQETRMLKVEVELDNADGKLKPGFFGYIAVELE